MITKRNKLIFLLASLFLCLFFQFAAGTEKSQKKGNYFDGKKDFVLKKDTQALNLKGNFSFEAWVKPQKAQGYKTTFRTVLSKGRHTKQAYGLYLQSKDGKIVVVLNNNAWRINPTVKYEDLCGRWNHLLFTFKKGRATLFLNGKVLDTKTKAPKILKNNDAPLYIGFDGDQSKDRYFKGQIKGIRLWSRALTKEEAKTAAQGKLKASKASGVKWQL